MVVYKVHYHGARHTTTARATSMTSLSKQSIIIMSELHFFLIFSWFNIIDNIQESNPPCFKCRWRTFKLRHRELVRYTDRANFGCRKHICWGRGVPYKRCLLCIVQRGKVLMLFPTIINQMVAELKPCLNM